MKNKIGFLGVGQCGGNVSDIAFQRGIPAFAVNTSQEDLDSLSYTHNKVIIGHSGGAAKDRKVAVMQLKESYTELLATIQNWLVTEKINVLIVAFSTGGGTGSGIGPALCKLMKEGYTQTIIALPILPSVDESIGNQVNTIDCVNQLIKLNLPTIFVDNEKYAKSLSKKSRRKLYDGVNSEILDNIEALLDSNSSKYGNIDQRDILRILSTPGFLSIGVVFKDNLKDNNLSKAIVNSFTKNIYAPLEFDKNISCAAFIYQCNDEMMNQFDQDQFYSLMGKPLEVYEGIYEPNDKMIGEMISIVLCGLSYPMKRINEIKSLIDDEKDAMTNKRTYEGLDLDTSWIDDIKKQSRVDSISFDAPKEKKTLEKNKIDSILDDFL